MNENKNLSIYTDGGSRGNPGPSAIGIIFVDENEKIIYQYKECIGKSTNNEAEYKALIKALEIAKNYYTKKIICFSDSELLVNQLTGIYKIKKEHLKKLFYKIKEIEKNFEKIIYNQIERENEFIKISDKLVNIALNECSKKCEHKFTKNTNTNYSLDRFNS